MRARVREVSGCVHRIVNERCVPEPVVQLGAHGDGVEKVLLQRLVASLQVVRPTDRTDARRAVGQRYEPEPAVLEPTDADVALALALEPAGIAKVTEQRRAVVVGVLLLALELVASSVSRPLASTTNLVRQLLVSASARTARTTAPSASKSTLDPRLRAPRAMLPGVAKQHFIQLRAPLLPRLGLRRIRTLGKLHEAAVRHRARRIRSPTSACRCPRPVPCAKSIEDLTSPGSRDSPM